MLNTAPHLSSLAGCINHPPKKTHTKKIRHGDPYNPFSMSGSSLIAKEGTHFFSQEKKGNIGLLHSVKYCIQKADNNRCGRSRWDWSGTCTLHYLPAKRMNRARTGTADVAIFRGQPRLPRRCPGGKNYGPMVKAREWGSGCISNRSFGKPTQSSRKPLSWQHDHY